MSGYAVVDPATGETVQTYPTITDGALAAAVAGANETFRTWSRRTSVAERAALISRVAQLHEERQDALAAIITREMGKPTGDAIGEIQFSAAIYQFYADNAEAFLADEPITLMGGEGSAIVRKSPLGVLLGIMPWNFPYYQVARFAGPNLIIGNPVLLKHAPQCPESAAAIEQIYLDAGFPAGAYTNIYASNDQVADIIANPDRAGRLADRIRARRGRRRRDRRPPPQEGRARTRWLRPVHPACRPTTSTPTVSRRRSTRVDNCGQACNAAKRFIVIDSLYDEFLEKFTAVGALDEAGQPDRSRHRDRPALVARSGGPAERTGRRGGCRRWRHDRVRRRAQRRVLPARSAHGRHEPTNPSYNEELFGPVAIVHKVTSEDEAIDLANDTPFGLGSYLFTTDPEQAARVADAIQAGMVYVNIVGADSPELPFGGVKRSGSGRELGRWGADEFVNKKLIRIGA